MHLQFDTGTDIAAIVLFDPSLHPEGLAGGSYEKRQARLGELVANGEIIFLDTASDGAYLLDLYIDEPVPDRLRELSPGREENGLLKVPSGELLGTGLDDLRARANPKRRDALVYGETHSVPAGDYAATVSYPEHGEDHLEKLVCAELGEAAWQSHQSRDHSVVLVFFGFIICASALWFHWAPTWVIAAVALLLWFLWRRAIRTRRECLNSGMESRIGALERQLPSVVIHLQRQDKVPAATCD